MNRRGFLGGLIGAASAMVLDPEKLLWVPGSRTIFTPKAVVAPPPRTIIGIRLDSGMPVYSDQLLSGICNPEIRHWDDKSFLKVAVMGDPGSTWIQIRGKCEMRFSDYSPSLAS